MKKGIVGIVGLGSVGKSVEHAFSFYYPTHGYDIIGNYSWTKILESNIIFICVPTPEHQNGRLDCSIVTNVLDRLSKDCFNGIIAIKSTIGIGFMNQSQQRYPEQRLVYMPEFLREKSNFTWFVNPDRIVISGSPLDIDEALSYFTWIEDSVPVLRMNHREAEIAKLAHNAFIAVKVSFTNEIEQICNDNQADPEHVMGVIWADRRVKSKEHLQPYLGPYSGKCVPKDTRELINASEKVVLLKAAEKVNQQTSKRFSKKLNNESESVKSRLKQV